MVLLFIDLLFYNESISYYIRKNRLKMFNENDIWIFLYNRIIELKYNILG